MAQCAGKGQRSPILPLTNELWIDQEPQQKEQPQEFQVSIGQDPTESPLLSGPLRLPRDLRILRGLLLGIAVASPWRQLRNQLLVSAWLGVSLLIDLIGPRRVLPIQCGTVRVKFR